MSFPTTNWTVLAQATLDGDTAGREALERFCGDYHPPVVAFLRARGMNDHEAADFTQEFFLELLRSQAWRRAEQSKGRFRTFLLGSLMHVIGRERARDSAAKRGGDSFHASLDDLNGTDMKDVAARQPDGSTFDREWALQLMEKALSAVERAVLEKEPREHWEVVRLFLPGAGEPPTYEDAAARLGITVGAMKTHVHRARQGLREELRATVARTVGAPHEIDEELAYLHRVLTSS